MGYFCHPNPPSLLFKTSSTMSDFYLALQEFLRAKQPLKIDEVPQKSIDIVLFDTHFDRQFSILCTLGLSNYDLPVNERENNIPNIELCFALPSYWDKSFQSDNSKWVIEKLKFLCQFVFERNTYFWDGHTMPNAKPNKPFSQTMRQEYLLFSKSLLYPSELNIFRLGDKSVQLLFIIPLFQKEFELKQARGTIEIKRKLVGSGVGEILDDFRNPVVKKRFFGIF
jgi:hypothetical protein